MPELYAQPITDDFAIEQVRHIRNLTSAGFSTFNGQISREEQKRWWQSMAGRVKGWLYLTEIGHTHLRTAVGYGVLRQEQDGRWWNSVAVLPKYQGFGYGAKITADLISRHDGPIYAAVRRDNPAAIAMHHKDDWQEVEGPDSERLIYFCSR